jgi:RHH-type proline utilization regulon transcriptional repressor/proline dehydrogenase/delta 1-pyrroline-5-carboxylate dehydrogenase
MGERYLWALQATGIRVDQRSDQSWLATLEEDRDELTNGRIRLLGASASLVTAATQGRPDLAVYAGPVLLAGRIEMLPFLREQAISITAHRFGTPNHLTDALI